MRRIVQIDDALLERRQLQLGDEHPTAACRRARTCVERLLDQLAQQRLRQAGGGRIDRRERLRQRVAAAHYAIARMDHLGAEEALAQLAHQPHARTGRKLLLLARIEIEEAQVQDFVAVAHAAHQRALGSELHGGVLDLALELHGLAAHRVGEACDLGFVLVAQRQVQHEVQLPAHTELLQLVSHRFGHRRCCLGCDSECCRRLRWRGRFRRCCTPIGRCHHTSASRSRIEDQHRLDLDQRPARKRRHTHCGSRRIRCLKMARHAFVDTREVRHVGEEYRHLHGVLQAAAGGRGHRLQVAEHLFDLGVEPFDQRHWSPDRYRSARRDRPCLPARTACE